MMEAVRNSETSVYSKETTWRYIPEDSNLHTRRRENLKSHMLRDLTMKTVFSCFRFSSKLFRTSAGFLNRDSAEP